MVVEQERLYLIGELGSSSRCPSMTSQTSDSLEPGGCVAHGARHYDAFMVSSQGMNATTMVDKLQMFCHDFLVNTEVLPRLSWMLKNCGGRGRCNAHPWRRPASPHCLRGWEVTLSDVVFSILFFVNCFVFVSKV